MENEIKENTKFCSNDIEIAYTNIPTEVKNIMDDALNRNNVKEVYTFKRPTGSRYSDWLRTGRLRGRGSSPGRVKNFHFSMSSRPALGSTQPPIQWVPGALSRG
jgi:hypothetical protein